MSTVTVRNLTLGEGCPKVIVPLCEQSAAPLLAQARRLAQSEADLIEWRVDAMEKASQPDVLLALIPDVRAALQDKPLLVTCRTERDGGEGPADTARYAALCRAFCESGQLDLIDIELSAGADIVRELTGAARRNHIQSIVSWHNFSATPTQAEMVHKLCQMQQLGADIAKLAVMPHSRADVVDLLGATAEMADHHTQTPVITVSMGALGEISRLACEAFGSAATFASDGKSSAPGQPSLARAKTVLEILHTAD